MSLEDPDLDGEEKRERRAERHIEDLDLNVEEKRERWMEKNKLPKSRDDQLSDFDRTVHHVGRYKSVFLKSPSVREVFGYLSQEHVNSEQTILGRTIGEITKGVDYCQSTVTKAVQELEEGPVLIRMKHASANRDTIIAPIPPIMTYLSEAMEIFVETSRFVPPPKNSRAAGIVSAYERHAFEDEEWQANNNIELWFRGELMGLVPESELDIQASPRGKGLLDVKVKPTEGKLATETWENVRDHAKALTQGLAYLPQYDPETGEYPSVLEAAANVRSLDRCNCPTPQCFHGILDLLDTGRKTI